MSDFREEEKLGKIYDTHLTRRIVKYLRPYRWHVAAAVSMSLAYAAMELAGPYLFHVAIDWFIVPGISGSITTKAAISGLLWAVFAYSISLFASFGIQFGQVRIMQWVGQETMYDLRKEIFEHLQRLPMSFFDRTPVGRLVTRATTDVDALNDLFASGVVAMLNDFVLLFGLAIFLLSWHFYLGLATLSPLPFMVLLTYFFRNHVRDANRRIRTAIARINGFLQEHISGMSVVQLFNREQKSRDQFANFNRIHMEAYKDAIDAFSYFYPGVEFLSMGGIALVYWVGGVGAIVGTLGIGVLVSFIQYAQRFFRPIQDLSEKFNILQAAMAASERIFQLLDEPVAIVSAPGTGALPHVRGEIEFRNVWFAYRGGANPQEEDWVLRDVSFHAEPGQTLAIVGHTGAGKTTIIQLLLRFYDIQRGQILIDGVDIREMNLQDLRRLFGIVLQDPFLFTGTLESNVKLGTTSIDRATVERSLREVGLGSYLDSQPRGIETPVTERGSTLSVGQRQLVSFARALAHDPALLILDEATSSVDTKTELMIREALDRLLKNRTAIVIAHRLSTIQHAQRILVFHKGRLREQGSHQELLALRGIYYRLYQLQYKEQELAAPLRGAPPGFSQPLPADD
ncbi:MAG TPA: ABC transporter ATP-binding protein [Candidatus Acidoferrales bacterium]|jgi:ATP-binding cassette subfamily B protein|nr:ABC transporter ATP-binding protein [Candidatus Acidoferrales bacterium]